MSFQPQKKEVTTLSPENTRYRITYKGADTESDFGTIYLDFTPRIVRGLKAQGTLLRDTHREITDHVRSYLWYKGVKVKAKHIVKRNLDVKECESAPDM